MYALSVFTHIVEDWAGWLLELRRVLAAGGRPAGDGHRRRDRRRARLAVPEGDGPGCARVLGNAWDSGGPVTVHDSSWVTERWGRAFEIVSYAPRVTGEPWPHDIVVARPRAGASARTTCSRRARTA